jgi:hypothetical protein
MLAVPESVVSEGSHARVDEVLPGSAGLTGAVVEAAENGWKSGLVETMQRLVDPSKLNRSCVFLVCV